MFMVAEQGKWSRVRRYGASLRGESQDHSQGPAAIHWGEGRSGRRKVQGTLPYESRQVRLVEVTQVIHPAAETGREHAISSPPAPSFPYLTSPLLLLHNQPSYLSICILHPHFHSSPSSLPSNPPSDRRRVLQLHLLSTSIVLLVAFSTDCPS